MFCFALRNNMYIRKPVSIVMNFISFQGCIKFLPPPGLGEDYQVCWGRISSCEEGKGISWLFRRIYGKMGMGKWKQYHLLFNIEAVGGKISSWAEGKETILGKTIKILKNVPGEEYQVLGKPIQPCWCPYMIVCLGGGA